MPAFSGVELDGKWVYLLCLARVAGVGYDEIGSL